MLRECPSADLLHEFLLGKLPEEEISRIGEHIAECPRCSAALESFDTSSDMLGVVRKSARLGGLRGDAELEGLVSRVGGDLTAVHPVPAISIAVGSQLGPYELLEKIGQGGMGTVYSARHAKLKRTVAIKVLAPHRQNQRAAIARFLREMEAVGRLDHPNIARAIDAGEANDCHYIVIEHIDGIDLARLVRRGTQLSVANACEIVRQAATALEHAHSHGLVHRDVKPSNLMLRRDGVVKLLDLGLASVSMEERREGGEASADADTPDVAGELTRAGDILGSPDFMSPEQAVPGGEASGKSDIYSLGCTLYYLLAGRAPFADKEHASLAKKLHAHCHETAAPIETLRPDIPQSVAGLVARLMNKNPAERPASAAEVATLLAPWAADASLPALLGESSNLPEPYATARPSTIWTWIAAAAGVALLALLAVAFLPPKGEKNPPSANRGMQPEPMKAEPAPPMPMPPVPMPAPIPKPAPMVVAEPEPEPEPATPVKHPVRGEYALAYGLNGRTILLLEADSLRVLGASGRQVLRSLSLTKPYVAAFEREKYFVAVAQSSLDLLDKETGSVVKSIDLARFPARALAIHPTRAVSYVAIEGADKQKTYSERHPILEVDEATGAVRELPGVFGQWVLCDATGGRLFTAAKELYKTGSVPDPIFPGGVREEWTTRNIVLAYDISGPQPKEFSRNENPGKNAHRIVLAPDDKALSYVGGGGAPGGLPGKPYGISALSTDDVSKPIARYAIAAYPYDIAYHPTANLVACANQARVWIFNRASSDPLEGRLGDYRFEGEIRRIFFTPDGKHLLIGYLDKKHMYVEIVAFNLSDDERAANDRATKSL